MKEVKDVGDFLYGRNKNSERINRYETPPHFCIFGVYSFVWGGEIVIKVNVVKKYFGGCDDCLH